LIELWKHLLDQNISFALQLCSINKNEYSPRQKIEKLKRKEKKRGC
jgi:hypothetical protein